LHAYAEFSRIAVACIVCGCDLSTPRQLSQFRVYLLFAFIVQYCQRNLTARFRIRDLISQSVTVCDGRTVQRQDYVTTLHARTVGWATVLN
jgi:hypothetical protein